MSQDQALACEAAWPPSFEEIRERAYDIWERHHRPEGFEVQFWFMAQRELMAERASSGSAAIRTALLPEKDAR